MGHSINGVLTRVSPTVCVFIFVCVVESVYYPKLNVYREV